VLFLLIVEFKANAFITTTSISLFIAIKEYKL